MAALTLGALGVVFGDIGTSPLYAVQAVFTSDGHAVHVNQPEVYGVISLVFWAITMIVSVKYVSFIMRADNEGEGGILALTALLQNARLKRGALTVGLVGLGVLGASLFYGDGVITPAISVLSAVAGLKVAVPSLGSLVLPISVVVLTLLFAIQRFGTKVVGNLFGPVMVLWFGVLGLVGIIEVAHHPGTLRALSPAYGARFFLDHGAVAFIALASVVLAVTGAEALYADMGHFGRRPIRRAWFWIVFPTLTLNYLAQGSLILRSPKSIANPFFLLLPGWAQLPMVLLATAATVIASQAVISGAFSVTQQAVQLGFLPRLTIRHTSDRELGQIYVPAVNASMFVTVLAIVIGFGSATALASAYGVAVTGTFVLNTILFLAVARLLWHKSRWLIALGAIVFLTVEVAFFAANLTKVVHGGWLPLAIAVTFFTLLMTWHKGRQIVTANRRAAEGPLRDFIEHLETQDFAVSQVPGVGVYLNRSLRSTPLALRANVERNHVLPAQVIIVSVQIEQVAHVPDAERLRVEPRIMFSGATGDPLDLPVDSITGVTVRFGFLDEPDVPAALRMAVEQRLIEGPLDVERATYFLSRVTIVPTDAPGMSSLRKRLFVTMSRNAANPVEYFRLPDDQTVTTSASIEL
jgi:KUP system potassium uptake protein